VQENTQLRLLTTFKHPAGIELQLKNNQKPVHFRNDKPMRKNATIEIVLP
jgi:hypothetical protein